ncbi:D-arabinono-1,4-lactone oxidase-domain-containing protein [Geopyxis carbonaria]|nr:D-arabinono-1,4-lactone oxidase-domain-containing protein [Geopyxis carbonaria]
MNPEAYKEFYSYTTDAISSLSWDPIRQRHIPFRASLRHKHSTWARTNHARPELYLKPQSTDELQLIVNLARQCGKQIVVVGSGHSPSDMTCTTSWMINLDDFGAVVSEDTEKMQIVVEAGIRLYAFISELEKRGWAMPNLGSIADQSIAGAIATSTHGSSLHHGLISESVVSLTLMLSSGKSVYCSMDQNRDLFQAALVSLGGLGIVTHVGFQAVPAFKIGWEQEVVSLSQFLKSWDHGVWTRAEFVRCWWFPYSERTVVWHGEQVDEPSKPPPQSWYAGKIGRMTYEVLLYFAKWFPSFMPDVERYVFYMQFGWEEGVKGSAVQKSYEALTLDCLFSQLVNEWAIPLDKGPEAIERLNHWLSGRQDLARIPYSSKGVYVHAPIEVRVSDSTIKGQKPWLDQSMADGPTLYLNATLYRPFLNDIPHWDTYYAAFEYLMKDLGGKPHWAKNFITPTRKDIWDMYPKMASWVKLREQLDPSHVFASEWLKRTLIGGPEAEKAIAEEEDFAITFLEGDDGNTHGTNE